MRFLMIFILLISFLPKVEAQNHVEEHYQFDSIYKTIKGYYNRGLYHKAAVLPDSLQGNRYVNGSTYYFFSRVYALSNEFDKTLLNLEKAVKGGITKTQIERMYDLDGFRESNLRIIYEMNYDKWHQEYLNSEKSLALDSNYINEIQNVSQEYSNALKLYNIKRKDIVGVKDSLNYYQTTKRFDSLRFLALVELTLDKGFPTFRTIGKEFYRYSAGLRYRIPDGYDENCKDWQKVKTMIYTEMKEGTIYPFYYAAIEDNMRLSRKEPQLYGTIPAGFIANKDVNEVLQYEDPEELNVRRRTVGLCAIQLEIWSNARELPTSLKEVEFK